MEVAGYIASVFIGISLGLIGGGGSILAVPILVYLFNVNPQLATTYSLFIVGITAFVAAIKHYQLGNLNLKTAFSFAIPSVVTLLLVRHFLLTAIPSNLFSIGNFIVTKDIMLMIIFGILMITAAFSMIKNGSVKKQVAVSKSKLIGIGVVVGVVTGMLGAGGGFLIIPALVFGAAISMKEAVGTSLLIIFINSAIGFLADVALTTQLNFKLLLSITAIALLGMFIGIQLSKKINGEKLKPLFGWFILFFGFFIIIKEIF
jgi:uncharacterized membrane protein YfcA